MASIPLKQQYGPTLGKLLQPRWRATAPMVRVILLVLATGLLALILGAVLTLRNTSYSHSGEVPFSFDYKDLHPITPDPGGYVKIARHSARGLESSYAVAPLLLAPYAGSLTGELPLVAAGYTRSLVHRFAHLEIEGEGKTRINSTLSGYQVLYKALLGGRTVYGRDVMLLPSTPGARKGVVVEMLSTEVATVAKPVGSSGVLETPLKTFAFG